MTDVNPFLEEGDLLDNPFLSEEERAELSGNQDLVPLRDAQGRRLRPSGELYATDKKLRMQQMHEDGVMGPQFGHLGGGRPAKATRASQGVAELAAKEIEKVKNVFRDGIDDSQPIGVRLQTVKQLLEVESKEQELALKERAQDFEEWTKVELVDRIMSTLDTVQRAGQLADEIDVVEGTATDVE